MSDSKQDQGENLKPIHLSAGSPDNKSRERTGLLGLDESLGGGLLQGSSLLVLGGAGSGKTTFALQFLLEAMNQGHRGMYLLLGQASPLLTHALPFHDQLSIQERQFRFQALSHPLQEHGQELDRFLSNLQGLETTRAVIEVAVPAEFLRESELRFCANVQRRLQSAGATTLVTNRSVPESIEKLGPGQMLAPSADGVLLMRMEHKDKSVRRTLTVLSLLGVAHEPEILELELSEEGLKAQREIGEAETDRHKGGKMLLATPIFRDSNERKQYGLLGKKIFKRDTVIHPRQMLFYDILTELNAPRTNFGLTLVYDAIVPFLARQGLIAPLDSVFPDYERRFLSSCVRRCVVDEKLFAVPLHTSARVLFYRKDLLQKYGFTAPRSWTELEESALTIVEKEKKAKLKGLAMYFPSYTHLSYLLDHLWSQGQDLYSHPQHWEFNKSAVTETLKRLHRWVRDPRMCGPGVLEAGYWDGVKDFLEGRSIYLHHWSDALRLTHAEDSPLKGQVDWCTLPGSGEESRRRVMLGGPCYVIPARTLHQGQAEEALKTIMDPDHLAAYDLKMGWPFPALREIYRDPKVMAKRPYYEQAERLLAGGKFIEDLPYIKGNYLNWENATSQVLSRYFSEDDQAKNAAVVEEVTENLRTRLSVFLPKPVYSDLVAKAVESIHRNLSRPLSVAQLSKELGVSRSHLIRQFKKGTKMTPLRYLNQARVEKAKELLQYTTFNVSEVSGQVGFKSIFHFSKVFRQISGRNPSEFKQFRYQPR